MLEEITGADRRTAFGAASDLTAACLGAVLAVMSPPQVELLRLRMSRTHPAGLDLLFRYGLCSAQLSCWYNK